MFSLFKDFVKVNNVEIAKLSNEELIQEFQKAREKNDHLMEDHFFNLIYQRTKKSVDFYKSLWYEKFYPWYNDEIDAEFKFQLLRRISDYGDIQLEHQGKKRGQKLGNNWKNNDQEKKFNLWSIAFAITKSIHPKIIHKYNDKIISLQEIKQSWKEKEDINYLCSFSDIESQINSNSSSDWIMSFEFEDTNEENRYNYWITESINLIKEFYIENPKKLYTIFKKEVRKENVDIFERLDSVLEWINFWIIDQKFKVILDDIKKRDEQRFILIKNLFEYEN